MGQGVPAGVEQYEERPDVVARCDAQEAVDALSEPGGIFLPEQVVEEDAEVFMPIACAQVSSDRSGPD
jgi:hypothetical protein